MSTHANMKASAPSSSRSGIRGANPTYKASLQKQSRGPSSTSAAKGGSDTKKIEGQGSAPEGYMEPGNVGGYGSGHYTPNK